MKEANPAKYHLARFFFLGLSFIQFAVCVAFAIRFGTDGKNIGIIVLFLLLGMLCLFTFFLVVNKVKRVAVGKNKIVIIRGKAHQRYNWNEVRTLCLIPFFNVYKLEIKGRAGAIYFFPSKNIDPAFGLLAKDTTKMGEIVEQRKKEYHIR